MANTNIVYPSHYRVLECKGGRWSIKNVEVFYGSASRVSDHNDITSLYGITEQAVVIELFRINGGKTGYYLANLRDRKYYYCGLDLESIKTALQSLGIGRADPKAG